MGSPNPYFVERVIEELTLEHYLEQQEARDITENEFETNPEMFYEGTPAGIAEDLAARYLTVQEDTD